MLTNTQNNALWHHTMYVLHAKLKILSVFLDAERKKGPKYLQTKYVLEAYEVFKLKLMAHPLENVSQQDKLPTLSLKNEAAILCT